MTTTRYDLVVVGAGPGGYVAAIRAAQLGLSVAVVEEDRPGGVCLNWGCIPSKAILTSAELCDEMKRHGADYGVLADNVRIDYERVIARSRSAADRLARGVESLFRKYGVTSVPGRGELMAANEVLVRRDGGETRLHAGRILLATGSRERVLPGLTVDGHSVLTSRQALESKRLPASVVVIGGGPIGLEFGYAYSSFGSEVTVLEMVDQLLPGADEEIAAELLRAFQKRGVTVHLGTRYESCQRTARGVLIEARGPEDARILVEAEAVLVAVGRVPASDGIGLERVQVETERGFVKVGEDLRTSVEGIFAIGDLIGPPLLAHKASAEGVTAAENMADGGSRTVDYRRIPACVYSQPEVATIGLSETEARRQGYEVKVAKLPFRAIGKAVASGHADGFVKMVVDARYGEILGCHIIGKGATDLIAEAGLGMALETTVTEVGDTVHAHPTLAEAIMEAALAAEGRSVNY